MILEVAQLIPAANLTADVILAIVLTGARGL